MSILQVKITKEQIRALEAAVDLADDPAGEEATIELAREALSALNQADEANDEFLAGMRRNNDPT